MPYRSEEHTSELQSHDNLVCRLLLEKKKGAARRATPCRRPAARRPPSRARRRGVCTGSTAVALAPKPEGPRVRPLGVFFFNDTATTEIYTLSLHDALPI